MTRHITDWQALQLIYGMALEDLSVLFSKRNLTFMPVKGAYLILTGNAEKIPDRKMVDIDLLIPEKMFDTTCDWFASLPGVTENPEYWSYERMFVFMCSGFPLYVELHRHINSPARFLMDTEAVFSRGSKLNDACILPDPIDASVMYVCHMLVHVIKGFDEQVYREMEVYIHQEGFCWDIFWQRARGTGITGFIWLAVRKCSRVVNAAFQVPPPPSLYAAFIDKFDLFMRSERPLFRRAFFEMPFVRNPGILLWYKICNFLKNKRREREQYSKSKWK